MSSQNIGFNDGFNQTSFVNSLGFIPTKYLVFSGSPIGSQFWKGPGNDFGPGVLNLDQSQQDGVVGPAFYQFLLTFGPGNPMPTTADAFFNAWRISTQANGVFQFYLGPTNIDLSNYYGSTEAMKSYGALVGGLSQLLGIPAQLINQPPTVNADDAASDWNILTTPTVPPPNPPINYPTINSSTMNAQFKAAFTAFLQSNPFGNGAALPSGAPDGTSFFNAWFKFTSVTATLQIPEAPLLTLANQATTGVLPSYESIYYVYHPGATKADFQRDMVSFYNSEVAKNGFFLPSQSFSSWVIRNTTQYNIAVAGTAPFSLVQEDKALIINRIIKLLIAMISVLQKIGVSQANQLKFITSFQNVYVQMQSQIPVFSRGDRYANTSLGVTTPLGRAGTIPDTERNQLNTAFNAAKTQTLSAFRGVQEDTAKQIQSRVNQTNDAVTQQTDMSTALLQQLSGIMGSIFR